tara:strand:- start:682 stop:1206 length:525 start_codon:yes stop_codon:yes gene_type:complete
MGPSRKLTMVGAKKTFLCIVMAATGLYCTKSTPSASNPQTEQSKKVISKTTKCPTTGIPLIEALLTAEGVLLWQLGQPFPKKNTFFDAIEIQGKNLCSGSLTMADGFSPAKPLSYTLLPNGNLKIQIPWNLERITQSILFRTDRSFTRIDFHFVPVDKLKRQIFVRGMKNEVFR